MVVGDRSHEVVMVGVRAWSRGEEIRRINVASMSIWGEQRGGLGTQTPLTVVACSTENQIEFLKSLDKERNGVTERYATSKA